jgi:hypothetical protein
MVIYKICYILSQLIVQIRRERAGVGSYRYAQKSHPHQYFWILMLMLSRSSDL